MAGQSRRSMGFQLAGMHEIAARPAAMRSHVMKFGANDSRPTAIQRNDAPQISPAHDRERPFVGTERARTRAHRCPQQPVLAHEARTLNGAAADEPILRELDKPLPPSFLINSSVRKIDVDTRYVTFAAERNHGGV